MRLCFARLYLLSLHLAVICNGEENIAENLDAEIAYNVPGEQQPISFASMGSEHTTAGFVVYCPCMGKSCFESLNIKFINNLTGETSTII